MATVRISRAAKNYVIQGFIIAVLLEKINNIFYFKVNNSQNNNINHNISVLV